MEPLCLPLLGDDQSEQPQHGIMRQLHQYLMRQTDGGFSVQARPKVSRGLPAAAAAVTQYL